VLLLRLHLSMQQCTQRLMKSLMQQQQPTSSAAAHLY
jgi:hypothetical protein